MIVDDERSSERSDAPTQLNYAQTPKWHRRKKVKRTVIGICMIAVMLVSIRFLGPLSRRFELIYWQNRCLDFQAENQIALEIDVKTDRVITSVPREWTRFYSLDSPPGLSSFGTIFLGQMRTPEGAERLIGVDLDVQSDVTKWYLEMTVRMYEPGSLVRLPVQTQITTFDQNARIDITNSATFFRGNRDPADAGHFTAAYEIGGRKGIIDGWITGDNTVVLEDRDQAQQ